MKKIILASIMFILCLSGCNQTSNTSSLDSSSSSQIELQNTKLYIVGDSTLCEFNDSYYYPRYGFGTQLNNYFNEKVQINNLALSGRSSKSFITEENYSTLKNSLTQGDYLLIGFGHNDEKSDDETRFTDATLPSDNPNSFKYSLYENYVKLALDKGATPILCSPIVRANSSDNYLGSSGHITETGNYANSVIELAQEKSVTSIDLTTITKELYTELGYNEAIYFHAMQNGKKDNNGTIIADTSSVDKTHLNIYGAKMVAYLFANALKNTNCKLKNYIDTSKLIKPTKEIDLVANSNYVYSDYTAPNLENYTPLDNFKTLSDGWYGTAFGETGGNPTSSSNGYMAKEINEGTFHVGTENQKGKFQSSSDGFAFAFRQIDISKNFSLSVDINVLNTLSIKQAGFGLMLRDDVYLPIEKAGLASNYVTAGFLCNSSDMSLLFSRENQTLNNKDHKLSSYYQVNDVATLTITRIGQKVTTTIIYKEQTYTKDFVDFDFIAKDTNYMYVGMFANRGTVIECTNVNFEITGNSQGA